jgi:hypothetical protein
VRNFDTFKLHVGYEYKTVQNKPTVLSIKDILDDFIIFLIEIGEEFRAEVRVPGQLVRNSQDEDSDEESSPRKRYAKESISAHKSPEAYKYSLPWKELTEKVLTYSVEKPIVQVPFTFKDMEERPAGQPKSRGLSGAGLPLLKLGSSSSVNAPLASAFFVTYAQPSAEKSQAVASRYYEVEAFGQAFCRLLADGGLVLHDRWPRLLLGLDHFALAGAREAGHQHRQLMADLRSLRLRTVKLWRPTSDRGPQSPRAIPSSLFARDYCSLLELKSESSGHEDPSMDDPLVEDTQPRPMPTRQRLTVPYIKVSLLLTPVRVEKHFAVVSLRLKDEALRGFFSPSSSGEFEAGDYLSSNTSMELYLPRRQTVVSMTGGQLKAILDCLGGPLLEADLLEASRRRLKPRAAAVDGLGSLLGRQLVAVGHDAAVLAGEHELALLANIGQLSLLHQDAEPREALRLVPLTDDRLEAFHAAIRKFDADLRRESTAPFLQHYNSVKRISGSDRLYLTLSYAGRLG